MRVPAVLAACATVLAAASITREVDGGRLAQGISAWGVAFGSFILAFGHTLMTNSFDMLSWVLIVLFVLRAMRRDDPRWWMAAGAIKGCGMDNKLLVVVFVVAILGGIPPVGPCGVMRTQWPWKAALLAVIIGSPNLVFQVLHDFPQLTMGAALGEENGSEVHNPMWAFPVLVLGPLLVPVWVAGIASLLRRTAWRNVRCMVPTMLVVLVFTLAAGSQNHDTYGLLICLYAAGSVSVAEWIGMRTDRLRVVQGAVGLNGLVAAVVSLPLVPVAVLGGTPIPAVNQSSADQVGWPRYAEQIAGVAVAGGAEAIITSNEGEAGAVTLYGDGRIPVVSGHHALVELGGPPPDAEIVVIVGDQCERMSRFFTRWSVEAELDNGLGVENEEQGQPGAHCEGPRRPWSEFWPMFAHLS